VIVEVSEANGAGNCLLMPSIRPSGRERSYTFPRHDLSGGGWPYQGSRGP